MKKILVVNIGTDLGGVEKSLIGFLRFLSTEDCQVDLLLWKKRGCFFSEIPKNINVIENLTPGSLSDIRKFVGIKKYKYFIYYIIFKLYGIFGRAWKCTPRIKTKYDIAISYTHDGYSPFYVIDNVCAKKKYLFYHHGSYEKSYSAKLLDEKYYAKYDNIITVSNANKEMLSSYFVNLSNKIMVVNNLLNEEEIIHKAQEKINFLDNSGKCMICTVGRFSKEKGQLFALDVAKILKDNNFKFKWMFVGDGPDKELCEEKIKEYGLADYCIMLGAKTNPYPYIYYSDLYVQTSFVESECITIKEAIILNKFIISTDIPAVKETLDYGKLGCLCEFDARIFADKIIYYSEKNNQTEILKNISLNPSKNVLIKEQIKLLLEL